MEEIAPGVFVETGYEGVNVGAIQTADGLLCVDAPSYPRDARHWAGQLARLFNRANRFLVLTDANSDRILNAHWLKARLITQASGAQRLNDYDKRFPTAMVDSLAQRNPIFAKELGASPVDKPALSFETELRLMKGQTEIILQHHPGPTRSNVWVMVPDVGVLFAGDSVVVNTLPPLEDLLIDDWLASLQKLSELKRYRILVPGRGPVGGLGLAAPMRERLTTFRALVADCHAKGVSPTTDEQVLAELAGLFEGDMLPESWVHRQVAQGAERVYNLLAEVKRGA